jgi:TRAP-type C4-dicarboxylate transport system permease small subunit
MRSLVSRLATLIADLATGALVLIAMAIMIDSVSRRLGFGSLPYVFDLSIFVLVATAFLPLALAQRNGEHPAFGLLAQWVQPGPRKLLLAVGYGAGLAVLFWLLVASGTKALAAFIEDERLLGIHEPPLWPYRLLPVVGLVVFILTIVLSFVRRHRL